VIIYALLLGFWVFLLLRKIKAGPAAVADEVGKEAAS
jgi:hypothetical protein